MKALLEIKSKFDSQKNMAKAIGVSEATVSDWMNGRKKISIANMNKLSKMFDVKKSDLRPDIFQ